MQVYRVIWVHLLPQHRAGSFLITCTIFILKGICWVNSLRFTFVCFCFYLLFISLWKNTNFFNSICLVFLLIVFVLFQLFLFCTLNDVARYRIIKHAQGLFHSSSLNQKLMLRRLLLKISDWRLSSWCDF